MTVEEAEHRWRRASTRTTPASTSTHAPDGESRFGKRLIYGGHVISLAHALSLQRPGERAAHGLAFNGGAHVNPTFAGDTLYAWTEVLDKAELGRNDVGALRLRLVGGQERRPARGDVPLEVEADDGKEAYHPHVVLDLDYWGLMPRR